MIRSTRRTVAAIAVLAGTISLACWAAGGPAAATPSKSDDKASTTFDMSGLVGTWEGTCRTWLRPGAPVDEARVRGTFSPLLDGRFLRHSYTATAFGKPRSGEETIVFNRPEQKVQISWFDTFHMNYGILFSEGSMTERGFTVQASYRMAPDQPAWSWRTEFELLDKDHLTITAFNILPDGREAKAVETVYTRVDGE